MPGIAKAELVTAVARAGGIGTLGLLDVSIWEDEIARTRGLLQGLPFAVNLLLPYTRRKHVDAIVAQKVPIVSLFWGSAPHIIQRLKENNCYVMQQVGSIDEAKRVVEQGVDAIIIQGKEAGGHVRGEHYLDELLPSVIDTVGDVPVFAAGGIYSSEDVQRVVALGCSGISTGTRFLLSDESEAHDAYKNLLLASSATVITKLFGFGWSDNHRVAINQSVRNWCDANGKVPAWLQRLNASFTFTQRLLPLKSSIALWQHPRRPFFSPSTLLREHPHHLLECTALYAGEKLAGITCLMPAADIVSELAKGFEPG